MAEETKKELKVKLKEPAKEAELIEAVEEKLEFKKIVVRRRDIELPTWFKIKTGLKNITVGMTIKMPVTKEEFKKLKEIKGLEVRNG